MLIKKLMHRALRVAEELCNRYHDRLYDIGQDIGCRAGDLEREIWPRKPGKPCSIDMFGAPVSSYISGIEDMMNKESAARRLVKNHPDKKAS